MCQATYTDELMGKRFLNGHLIMCRGVMHFPSTWAYISSGKLQTGKKIILIFL